MDINNIFNSQPKLGHVELLLFTKYLSVLLRSGLPIDESLEILNKQSAKKKNKKTPLSEIISNLTAFIRTGKTLADGLSQYKKTFSPVYINLIRAGENSGTLQDNLDQLVVQQQKEHDMVQKVRGAMMYPAVIMCVGIGIAAFIVVFILPQITGLFSSMNIKLPFTTRVVFWISDFIRAYWPFIIVGAVLSSIGVSIAYRIKVIKPAFHSFFLNVPILGKLSKEINLARSFRLMGTLLKSGLPVNECFDVTIQVVRNIRYQKMFAAVKDGIARGSTITSVLEKYSSLVPPIGMRLVMVGEETATLGAMFLYLAEFYEAEVDDLTKNITSLIEPILIVSIGLGVGWLAVSIMSPIYGMVGSV